MRQEPVMRSLNADMIEKMRVASKVFFSYLRFTTCASHFAFLYIALRASTCLMIQLGREVLDEAAKAIAIGVTTDEIDRIVHEVIITLPSWLNKLYLRMHS